MYLIDEKPGPEILDKIVTAVLRAFKVKEEDLVSPSKLQALANPRHAIAAIAVLQFRFSRQDVALRLNRERSTIYSSLNRFIGLHECDQSFRARVNEAWPGIHWEYILKLAKQSDTYY